MEKLISVIGLTSSGKSALAVELAKMFNGEIVSADSRQVYVGLDWCSGKITKDEMQGVKHHLLDVVSLGTQFTLYDFQCQAYSAIDDILSRGKQPFLVGGTGLYSRSVVEGYNLSSFSPNAELRKSLENLSLDELKSLCEKKGIEFSDEPTKRRLIRLIEKCDLITESSGEKKSYENSEKNIEKNTPRYDVLQIGINWEREKIYNRIKQRLISRLPHMIDEVKNLLGSGVKKEFLISLGLEAKLVTQYILGEFPSYESFFDELFKQECHFAKRQQTWMRREKNVVWLDAEDNLLEKSAKLIENFLKNN